VYVLCARGAGECCDVVKSKAAASETGETGETAGGRNGCGSDGLSDAAAVTEVMGCRASAMMRDYYLCCTNWNAVGVQMDGVVYEGSR
jgi:hypothetical protein